MTKVVHTQIVCGMPHLLSNFDLNLNQMSKCLGDIHWHYMYARPVDARVDGNRVYQSFLQLDFDIVDKFKEDDVINIITTGEQVDDAIFKTVHTFGNNKITLYSIGIIIDKGSLVKAITTKNRDLEFWANHRNLKRVTRSKEILASFNTYPSIDFNCAGILYCANYVRYIYQFADILKKQVTVKNIYFFGNIKPYQVLDIVQDEHGIHIISEDQLIATCICELE